MRIRENLFGPDAKTKVSFEDLIAQNEPKILNVIYGMTGDYHLAQDLTQEAFIKAFKAKDTFQGQAKFSTWLYRIAVNVTIDHQRKSCVRNEKPTEENETIAVATASSDPDQRCQKRAIKDILFKSIAQLPDDLRQVFLLREINGCSTKETAAELAVSVELVKWRLHKARATLRKNLSADEQYQNIGTFKLNGLGIE